MFLKFLISQVAVLFLSDAPRVFYKTIKNNYSYYLLISNYVSLLEHEKFSRPNNMNQKLHK